MIKILLVEDDLSLSNSVFDFLDDFADVMQVFDGDEGLYEAESNVYDLILLDLMLPEKNGFQLLKELREKGITTPVLIMTAKESLDDKGHGFELGADDYLTKPFELNELIARVYALSRRHRGYSSNQLQSGQLHMNLDTQEVSWHSQNIQLSRREYSLLETFLRHPNQILKNEELIDKVYGFQDSIESNALNVHIYHLRHKIHPDFIQTVRGVGYIFKPELLT